MSFPPKPDKRLKVLVSGLSNNLGGTEAVVGTYALALDADVQFEYMAFEKLQQLDFVKGTNSVVHICPDNSRPMKRAAFLRDILLNSQYDAVWVNCNHLLHVDVLHEAKKAGVPVRICHAHNTEFLGSTKTQFLSNINRGIAIRDSTIRLACSEAAGKFFFRESSYQVLPNAVNTERFTFNQVERDRIRRDLSVCNDLVLVNVARLSKQKNQDFLLRVVAGLRSQNVPATLLLVGSGELRSVLEESARILNINEYVRFVGAQQDVSSYLSASDIFLFPSLFEGLGISCIEAQFNGLTCLVSECLPPETRISRRINYLPLDIDVWVEAIINLSFNISHSSTLTNDSFLYNISKTKDSLYGFLSGKLR